MSPRGGFANRTLLEDDNAALHLSGGNEILRFNLADCINNCVKCQKR
jgi:hypothetical protein